jgi:allantoin racemase
MFLKNDVTHRTPARRLLYLEGVTYSGAEAARRLALLNQHLSPGFSIGMLIPPDGPGILERAEDFEQLRRVELRAVAGVNRGECGAIIAAGAVDPNLSELRAAARVPVIGPGEASLFLARILGSRLVILTVEPAASGARHMIDRVTARPPAATVRALPTTVRSILADPDEGRALLRRAAAAAVHEDTADVLYLGAMTLGTLGITEEIAATLGVAVIDPLPVSIHAAEAAALAR